MLKLIVVYESKYGNTKLVAENIIAGIKEVSKTEVILSEVKQVNFDNIISSDAILSAPPTTGVGLPATSGSLSINSAKSTWTANRQPCSTHIYPVTSRRQSKRWRNR